MKQQLDHYCRQRQTLFYPKADLPCAQAAPMLKATDAEVKGFAATVFRATFATRPTSVRPLKQQGTFHRLYRVSDGSKRTAIVKLNARQCYQRDFALHLDPWGMQQLRTHGLPNVRVHQVDLSRRLGPFDYEILDEAAGTPLKVLDDNEAQMHALLPQLGRLLACLHTIRTQGYGLLDIRPLVGGNAQHGRGLHAVWRDHLYLNLEEHLEIGLALGAVHACEVRRILTAFRILNELFASVRPVLLHGDLGNHNIFTDGERITALIDWEDCLSGDPVYDIAFWASFHPERRHETFLSGYSAEAKLPKDFQVRFWIYFLRIALAKMVVRHRLGLRDRSGRAPAGRRIQLGLAKVENLLHRRRQRGSSCQIQLHSRKSEA
jgi:Ser/Thr protein kinase RdoA (MazF antagonist)